MMDLFVERFARFWMPPGETDPISALRRRHKKADGTSLTQFNTGGLIIGSETTIVMSDCQPYLPLPNWLQLVPPSRSLDRIRDQITAELPTPAWIFFLKKGEVRPDAWVPSIGGQYVVNLLDGPMMTINRRNALMAKAHYLRGQGALYKDGTELLLRRLNTNSDTSALDEQLSALAKRAGVDPLTFVEQLEPLTELNRDEWKLGQSWGRQ